MAEQVPDHVHKTIQLACGEVDRLTAELVAAKKGVNAICAMFKLDPVYQDVSEPERANLLGGRSDRYVGKPLAKVVRSILTARHDSGVGPAEVEELYAEMLAGGFDFEDKNEENSKRGLAVSLAKNTQTFYRLKNGEWGLREWYPNLKQPKGKGKAAATAETEEADEEDAVGDGQQSSVTDEVFDELFNNVATSAVEAPVNKPR